MSAPPLAVVTGEPSPAVFRHRVTAGGDQCERAPDLANFVEDDGVFCIRTASRKAMRRRLPSSSGTSGGVETIATPVRAGGFGGARQSPSASSPRKGL